MVRRDDASPLCRRNATSSQVSTLYSSVSLGNLPIDSRPFQSMSDSLGRAPPNDDPGAKIICNSSSVSSTAGSLRDVKTVFEHLEARHGPVRNGEDDRELAGVDLAGRLDPCLERADDRAGRIEPG
jgi:hypothetical protein